jgi:hypothetical protein
MLFCHPAQREQRKGRHVAHQTAAMHLLGRFADADVAGNLLVVKIRRLKSTRPLASHRFLAIFAGTKRQILSTSWGGSDEAS